MIYLKIKNNIYIFDSGFVYNPKNIICRVYRVIQSEEILFGKNSKTTRYKNFKFDK